MRVAGIDCGTNSIRLLIAEAVETAQGPRLDDIERRMQIVRLGQGVDATGEFAPQALERTYAAVREYAQLIAQHGVQASRFVATSATRDAANRDEFIDTVKSILGVSPEVISGDEEARLSFAGATGVRTGIEEGTTLVIDLGGGSTEFVIGRQREPIAARSIDMGCVRLTERFFTDEVPDEYTLGAARAFVDSELQKLSEQLDFSQVRTVIGVAGTITTLTAHALGLERYESERIHAASVGFEQMRQATGQILGMNREQRTNLGFMHPGRVDVIQAGALILERITTYLEQLSGGKAKMIIASEHDILDGIAASVVVRHSA